MTNNAGLTRYKFLSEAQRFLLLLIWFMTLLVLTIFTYTEYYPVSFGQHFYGQRFTRWKKNWDNGGEVGNFSLETTAKTADLYRGTLTKAVYPLTVTAPFIIENPDICDGDVTVLIIVHTAVSHFDRRVLLRRSLGNTNLFKSTYHVKIVFLLGQVIDEKRRKLVQDENAKYHDIVQGDFIDTYRNLTLKGVMAFRWISLHCAHAKLILKMDDDIYVNIFKIMEYYVPKYSGLKKLILCNKMYPSPVLRRITKWSVDDDYFRRVPYYPPYCSGFTVLMTPDTVRIMYTAAHFTPFFWVDDVYLFGLLPSKGNIDQSRLDRNVSLDINRCKQSYASDTPTLVSCTAPRYQDFEYFWNRTIDTMSPSLRKLVNETALKSIFN